MSESAMWTLAGCGTLVMMIAALCAALLAFVVAFSVRIVRASSEAEPPRRYHEPAPDARQAAPEDQQAAPEREPPEPPRGGFNGSNVAVGRCRGCGNMHFGLIPAAVEVDPREGSITIPEGVPAVCPRCWCAMNPRLVTNLLPAVDSLIPVPRPTANPVAPAPVTSATDAEQSPDTGTDEPPVKCDRCGNAEAEDYDELVKDGTPTGKFWCRACIRDVSGEPPKAGG